MRDCEVGSIFERLADFDLAVTECLHETSYCRRVYGRRLYNGGVIAYRHTPTMTRLLEFWRRLTYRQHRLLGSGRTPGYVSHVASKKQRQRLLRMDQISLAQILSPDVNRLGARHLVLDTRWNERRPPAHRPAGPPPLIEHLPEFHSNAVADLLAVADDWSGKALPDRASPLYAVIRDLVADRAVSRPDQDNTAMLSGPALLSELMQGLSEAPDARAREACERALLHSLFGQAPQAQRWTRSAAEILCKAIDSDLRFSTEALIEIAMTRPKAHRLRKRPAAAPVQRPDVAHA